MEPLSQEEREAAMNKAPRQFPRKEETFYKSQVPAGETITLHCLEVSKNRDALYKVDKKDFGYVIHLDPLQSQGKKVWLETSESVVGRVLKILYPDGKTVQPAAIRLTRLTKYPPKCSPYAVERV